MNIKFLAILLFTISCSAQVRSEVVIEPVQSALYGSEEVSSLSNDDIICYNALKDAFFSERSDLQNIKTLFDETFPEPTEEVIELLGYLLPNIEPWQEINPPRTHAIIGQKRVFLEAFDLLSLF
jgi:hypothetical protein